MGKEMSNRFNIGTQEGTSILKRAISELGCIRSVLADKNGEIIAGHDVYDISVSLGKKIVTIETDGDVLVVVKRTDLDAKEKRGLEMSLVDVIAPVKNLNIDVDGLIKTMQEDISFDPRKWGAGEFLVRDLDLSGLFVNDAELPERKEKKQDEIDTGQLSLFDLI